RLIAVGQGALDAGGGRLGLSPGFACALLRVETCPSKNASGWRQVAYPIHCVTPGVPKCRPKASCIQTFWPAYPTSDSRLLPNRLSGNWYTPLELAGNVRVPMALRSKAAYVSRYDDMYGYLGALPVVPRFGE